MSSSAGERRIEIFRTGTHRPMRGPALAVDAAMLGELASSYDAANHEAPLVIGHPAADDPAHGWVKDLRVEGDRLVATVDAVHSAFAEAVRDGAFKKISPWLYQPEHPANPTPGKWHLKHVGFLGAQVPAVKGLRAVRFGEADAEALGFVFGGGEDAETAWFRNVADIFRGIREFMIERDGKETADEVLPAWRIDWLRETAARMTDDSAFAEPETDPEQETDDMSKPNPTPDAADLDKRQAELDARAAELDQRGAAFAEREAADRTARNEAFVAGLVADAKLPSAMSAQVLAFMEAIGGMDAFAFGAGDGAENVTPAEAFMRILGDLPALAPMGEAAGADKAPPGAGGYAFAAPGGYAVDPDAAQTDARARAYMNDHPDTPYLEAVKAVQAG